MYRVTCGTKSAKFCTLPRRWIVTAFTGVSATG
jgi:hypothetical protein